VKQAPPTSLEGGDDIQHVANLLATPPAITVRSRIAQTRAASTSRTFAHIKPVRIASTDAVDELQGLWLNIDYLGTVDALPGPTRRVLVTQKRTCQLQPILHAVATVKAKTIEVRTTAAACQDGNAPAQTLALVLQGAIAAAVG